MHKFWRWKKYIYIYIYIYIHTHTQKFRIARTQRHWYLVTVNFPPISLSWSDNPKEEKLTSYQALLTLCLYYRNLDQHIEHSLFINIANYMINIIIISYWNIYTRNGFIQISTRVRFDIVIFIWREHTQIKSHVTLTNKAKFISWWLRHPKTRVPKGSSIIYIYEYWKTWLQIKIYLQSHLILECISVLKKAWKNKLFDIYTKVYKNKEEQ